MSRSFGLDALRYFVDARDAVRPGRDFSDEGMLTRFNATSPTISATSSAARRRWFSAYCEASCRRRRRTRATIWIAVAKSVDVAHRCRQGDLSTFADHEALPGDVGPDRRRNQYIVQRGAVDAGEGCAEARPKLDATLFTPRKPSGSLPR